LSELNNQYIVRYYQTWVELENDPNKLKDFPSDDDDYDSEDAASESQMSMMSVSKRSEDILSFSAQTRNQISLQPKTAEL
jgi:hypothetical protein